MSEQLSSLRAYRASNRISLEEIGAPLGVNRSTILRWETGRVPAERVLDVERVTGLSRHVLRPDIYGGEPAAPAEVAA